ncbi:N-6 DNA methylase [Psychroflexus sp. CAK1W]|uniref:class I SAM-dependent DNA methyltransferase n=1 Tax=Psychroflexus curvus TaxID=2873595 RepID=UPI001CCC3C2F|nr:DNA methyltransferase [Psychroflexus curvus]MBZ9627159.1 N-6 DNA methylase [Psychroflexus curvus]
MTSTEIHDKVQELVNNFNTQRFIYDLLRAYGISKTSITRLQKGDFNLAKNKDEILYKKKLFFKEVDSDNLMALVDDYSKDENLKHNPRFIIITNYNEIAAKDTRTNKNLQVSIKDLPKNHTFFLPWAGQEVYTASNENEADRKASYRMAKLYDILIEENPEILENGVGELNLFFSRLLFCFFAEDTDIFPIKGMFTNNLMQHTQKDGSDVHLYLDKLFKALNTKDNSKQASYISQFPYVNGGLFQDVISIPKFNKQARNILEESGELDWSHINPDIFGSMIQAVVNPDQRGNLGMHYTSVPNIMKVIKPLFLDDLYEELEKAKGNSKKLRKLLDRISKLKIFDPACGSGNFLIIAYKELRKLEIEIWQALLDTENQQSFIYSNIQLTQFYGIEIDDFAHEIAKLSLWLAEHQMNKYFENQLELGKSNPILPLKASGNITLANATRVDWEKVCPKHKDDEIYLLGNPPYLGYKGWEKEQKEDMSSVFKGLGNVKRLDYISCWFKKGADYIKNSNSRTSFVSTNSICQGEQVSLLWPYIFNNEIEIGFAHTTFNWSNNAKSNAGVSVVIIGLQNKSNGNKKIYNIGTLSEVDNINPYLTGAPTIFIEKRNDPISSFPKMALGSSGIDGGHLVLTLSDKMDLEKKDEKSSKFIKPYLGGNDFLNGYERYCLWINDDEIEEAKSIEKIKDRIDKCYQYRINGGRDAKKASSVPHRFFYRKYEEGVALALPFTSSLRREYLPVDFLRKETVASNGLLTIYDADIYIFGILISKLHILWAKAISGRMRNDIRYSVNMVYNTFPFPEISRVKKANIEENVYAVLEEREKHPEKTMAELYDPDKMPKGLRQAHKDLDEAVERCYRLQPFENDTQRLEYLFKEYEKMVAKDTLFQKLKRTRKKKVN